MTKHSLVLNVRKGIHRSEIRRDTKHSGKPKQVCNICEEQFERTDVLKKHQRFVYQIEPRKVILPGINENVNHFECYVCKVSFKEKYKLNRHLETMHNDNSDRYNCPTCGKQFKRKDYLQKHSKTHIKIICKICLKHFESKDGLKAHRIGNHV